MNVSVDERLRYHPDPSDHDRRSTRKVDVRRKLIIERSDPAGKRLIDLGCSGGYFGFSLADIVKEYVGIDGDEVLISRNSAAAKQRNLANLSFRHAVITPSLVRSLPAADIALFLSVFHHILATSTAYGWNKQPDFDPLDILTALRERVEVLVFETGYPDEGFEWCARLPRMEPTPRAWVTTALRNAGFRYVEVVPTPQYQGLEGRVRQRISQAIDIRRSPRSLASRVASRLFNLDTRDGRDVFIARR
jgi:SAM-dependent methyltransferase